MTLVRRFVALGTLMLLILASGCGSSVTTTGKNMKEFFVITEGWFWQYSNTEGGDLYEVWSMGEGEREGQTVNVFAWKFANGQALAEDEVASPPELFFMESYWSKDEDGVWFWGAGEGDGTGHDDTPWSTEFLDPALFFGGTDMYPDSSEESSTSGLNWTSEYVEDVAELDTGIGMFEDVLHIHFADTDATHPFAGDYWLGRQAGILQFQLMANPDQIWNLKKYEQ